jgi:putative FmdB family regulatory protein
MPTYEFKCPKGHAFDRFYKKMSDAPLELTCPECGAVAERQLSGGVGLLFKGSGFYLTDYGKNAHRKGGSGRGEEGSAKGEGGKPESAATKTEGAKTEGTKSEAKSDSSKAKTDSPKPTTEGPKPKKE